MKRVRSRGVQTSTVKQSAAARTSQWAARHSRQVVRVLRSRAGSRPRSLRTLARGAPRDLMTEVAEGTPNTGVVPLAVLGGHPDDEPADRVHARGRPGPRRPRPSYSLAISFRGQRRRVSGVTRVYRSRSTRRPRRVVVQSWQLGGFAIYALGILPFTVFIVAAPLLRDRVQQKRSAVESILPGDARLPA